MKKLLCINTYEEDLTGFDDFAIVWKAGKIYDATHHKNGTWTVKTEQGKNGIIGECEQSIGGYHCNYDTHFVDIDKITLLDAVRYAYNKGYFTVEDKDNYGCYGIHCETHGVNSNGFYCFSEYAEDFETANDYVNSVGDYGICQEITEQLKAFIEDDCYPEESECYLLDMLSVCKTEDNIFDNVIGEWIDKAEKMQKQDERDEI